MAPFIAGPENGTTFLFREVNGTLVVKGAQFGLQPLPNEARLYQRRKRTVQFK
jgi:hypothetical protein